MVIRGVGVLPICTLANDSRNAVENGIHILLCSIIGRHIGALHNLGIRLAQLRIQLLYFLLVALLLLGLIAQRHPSEIKLADQVLQFRILITGIAGSAHGKIIRILLAAPCRFPVRVQ